MKVFTIKTVFLISLLGISLSANAQIFPGAAENIKGWFVSGPDADVQLGDDRHMQIIYFDIPADVDSFYVRIYDAEAYGENDAVVGSENSTYRFSVAGGSHAHIETNLGALPPQPLLQASPGIRKREIGSNPKSDKKWMALGPIKPRAGGYYSELDAYRFRFMAEGLQGDDGNYFKFALSTEKERITPVEGARVFAYHLCVQLPPPPGLCHLFPSTFPDMKSIITTQYNWNASGGIRMTSAQRKGDVLTPSSLGNWAQDTFQLKKGEPGKPMDIQIIRSQSAQVNRMTFGFGRMGGKALPVYLSGASTKPKE